MDLTIEKYSPGKAIVLLACGNAGVANWILFSILFPLFPIASIIGLVWSLRIIYICKKIGNRRLFRIMMTLIALSIPAFVWMMLAGWAIIIK